MWGETVTNSTASPLDVRSFELRELRAQLKQIAAQLEDQEKRAWHAREELALLRERVARLEGRGA